MVKELTTEQYRQTTGGYAEMEKADKPSLDIWPYVAELVRLKVVPKRVLKEKRIDTIGRTPDLSHEYILLASGTANLPVILVIRLEQPVSVLGYYRLDIEKRVDETI